MPRLIVAVCLVLCPLFFLPAAESGEKGKDKPTKDKQAKDKQTEKQPEKLTQPRVTWWGHSFFIVESTKGTLIAFDPHGIQQYGRIDPPHKADIIIMSHNHSDHNQIAVFDPEYVNEKAIEEKKVHLIYGLDPKGGLKADWKDVNVTINDVKIRNVGTFHDSQEGLKYGKNSAFVVEVDGWKFCHLGDLGHVLTPAQAKKIGPVDVLMVPVGGIYALNGSEAKEVVAQLRPKEYIFPMHYGTKVFDDLLPLKEFLEDQERNKVTSSPDNKIVLNRDSTRPRPLIVELNYWPKGTGKD